MISIKNQEDVLGLLRNYRDLLNRCTASNSLAALTLLDNVEHLLQAYNEMTATRILSLAAAVIYYLSVRHFGGQASNELRPYITIYRETLVLFDQVCNIQDTESYDITTKLYQLFLQLKVCGAIEALQIPAIACSAVNERINIRVNQLETAMRRYEHQYHQAPFEADLNSIPERGDSVDIVRVQEQEVALQMQEECEECIEAQKVPTPVREIPCETVEEKEALLGANAESSPVGAGVAASTFYDHSQVTSPALASECDAHEKIYQIHTAIIYGNKKWEDYQREVFRFCGSGGKRVAQDLVLPTTLANIYIGLRDYLDDVHSPQNVGAQDTLNDIASYLRNRKKNNFVRSAEIKELYARLDTIIATTTQDTRLTRG